MFPTCRAHLDQEIQQPMALEQVMAKEDNEDEVDDHVADLEDRIVCSVSLFTLLTDY